MILHQNLQQLHIMLLLHLQSYLLIQLLNYHWINYILYYISFANMFFNLWIFLMKSNYPRTEQKFQFGDIIFLLITLYYLTVYLLYTINYQFYQSYQLYILHTYIYLYIINRHFTKYTLFLFSHILQTPTNL